MGRWNLGRSQLPDKVNFEAPAAEDAGALEDNYVPMGLPRNSEAEAAKCYTDDVLLYRMILLQVVAQIGRDVRLGQDSKLRLNPKEQPAEPPQEPTCASFWRTGEWKALKTILEPTSLALNFPFQTPQRRLEEPVDLRPRAEVTSKDLARWAPGMMREVATQVVKHIQKRRVTLQVLSWREHLAQGHTPF